MKRSQWDVVGHWEVACGRRPLLVTTMTTPTTKTRWVDEETHEETPVETFVEKNVTP